MTRWRLTIEYDGGAFSGWQTQRNAVSIQQTIEQAITKFSGEDVTLHVAGRTDAGVHARAQVAHFDLEKSAEAATVRDAVNFYLRPHTITILKAEPVDAGFHARFDARGRSYRYRILGRVPPPALDTGKVWHLRRPLNAEAMHEAAQHLLGKHDFTTFRALNCQANSPIRTLERLDVRQEGEEIVVWAGARSFLYHQVRNMVGTLAMVGGGQWDVAQFKTAFAACDRSKGGPTAPACGLTFWDVSYPQN